MSHGMFNSRKSKRGESQEERDARLVRKQIQQRSSEHLEDEWFPRGHDDGVELTEYR